MEVTQCSQILLVHQTQPRSIEGLLKLAGALSGYTVC